MEKLIDKETGKFYDEMFDNWHDKEEMKRIEAKIDKERELRYAQIRACNHLWKVNAKVDSFKVESIEGHSIVINIFEIECIHCGLIKYAEYRE